MRTRRATANGGHAGGVLVLLAGVLLPERGRLARHLAQSGHKGALDAVRARYGESNRAANARAANICAPEQGGPDTARQAGIQRGKRASGTPIGGRPNVRIAQHPGHLLPCAVVGHQGHVSQPRQHARPGATAFTQAFQGRVRMSPSCTTDTTSSPSWVKTSPRASPRAPQAAGDSWAYRSHRSARNGR
jgi:hypothetical protein